MQKLIVFNHVTLDGYFVDANGSMNWARADKEDAEWNAFVAENANSGVGALLFGRVTYDLMIQFWPTPMAIQHDRAVAEVAGLAEELAVVGGHDHQGVIEDALPVQLVEEFAEGIVEIGDAVVVGVPGEFERSWLAGRPAANS